MSTESIEQLIMTEAKKRAKDLVKEMSKEIDESTSPLRIVMNNDRGLCVVGHVNLEQEGDFVTIYNARCIIRWGTSKHLAELAEKGPMENTKLGFQADHVFGRSSIALILTCNVDNWI